MGQTEAGPLFSCAGRSSISNLPPAFYAPAPSPLRRFGKRKCITREPRDQAPVQFDAPAAAFMPHRHAQLTSHCHQFAFIKLSGRLCRQAAIYVPVAKLPRFAAASSHARHRQSIYFRAPDSRSAVRHATACTLKIKNPGGEAALKPPPRPYWPVSHPGASRSLDRQSRNPWPHRPS
jgi:hypothetical protein